MIKVNNEVVKIERFPDGTLNIKGDSSIQDKMVVISWYYEDDSEFMTIAFLTKFYQSHGNEVALYLPYVPNARMDRVELSGDIFAMKYFGELINSLNFTKVFVMDVHSSVAIAVIKNCHILYSRDIVTNIIKHIALVDKMPIMFYPDEGAVKRYNKEVSIPYPLPYAFGVKKRDWETGKILGLDILGLTPEQIKGQSILIRDDICSKGGTFYYAAKKLKELGADKIYLFITHCENSIFNGSFGEDGKNLIETGLIDHIFTTNSIYNGNNENISVIKSDIVYMGENEHCCGCEKCFDNCR